MKDFLNRYSYNIVKLFIHQFAISLFGAGLSFVAVKTDNAIVTLVLSGFSALFYLFLIYTMMWEVGATDKISVDVGKRPYRPLMGLYMALIANIPNYIVALVFTIIRPFAEVHAWATGVIGVLRVLSAVPLHGMYNGMLMVLPLGSETVKLYDFWWVYFLLTVPCLVACFLAYYLGHRNFRFSALILPRPKDEKKK